jgi:hypothetical protein
MRKVGIMLALCSLCEAHVQLALFQGIQGGTGIMNLGFFSIWCLQLEWVEGGAFARAKS